MYNKYAKDLADRRRSEIEAQVRRGTLSLSARVSAQDRLPAVANKTIDAEDNDFSMLTTKNARPTNLSQDEHHKHKTIDLSNKSATRMQRWFMKLDKNEQLYESLNRYDGSMGDKLYNHSYRERNAQNDVSKVAFTTICHNKYLKPAERAKRAEQENSRFMFEVKANKRGMTLRAPEPLKNTPKGFNFSAITEVERVLDTMKYHKRQNESFNKDFMTRLDVHRDRNKNKWLNNTGFQEAKKVNSLGPNSSNAHSLRSSPRHSPRDHEQSTLHTEPFNESRLNPDFVRTTYEFLNKKNTRSARQAEQDAMNLTLDSLQRPQALEVINDEENSEQQDPSGLNRGDSGIHNIKFSGRGGSNFSLLSNVQLNIQAGEPSRKESMLRLAIAPVQRESVRNLTGSAMSNFRTGAGESTIEINQKKDNFETNKFHEMFNKVKDLQTNIEKGTMKGGLKQSTSKLPQFNANGLEVGVPRQSSGAFNIGSGTGSGGASGLIPVKTKFSLQNDLHQLQKPEDINLNSPSLPPSPYGLKGPLGTHISSSKQSNDFKSVNFQLNATVQENEWEELESPSPQKGRNRLAGSLQKSSPGGSPLPKKDEVGTSEKKRDLGNYRKKAKESYQKQMNRQGEMTQAVNLFFDSNKLYLKSAIEHQMQKKRYAPVQKKGFKKGLHRSDTIDTDESMVGFDLQ